MPNYLKDQAGTVPSGKAVANHVAGKGLSQVAVQPLRQAPVMVNPVLQGVFVYIDGKMVDMNDKEFEELNKDGDWIPVKKGNTLYYINLDAIGDMIPGKKEPSNEVPITNELTTKDSQESVNTNIANTPYTPIVEIRQPRFETTFTASVRLIPLKSPTLVLPTGKGDPIEPKYNANGISVRHIEVSEKDRPKTQYVQYQRSHSVAWVLLVRTISGLSNSSLIDLYGFIMEELQHLQYDEQYKDVSQQAGTFQGALKTLLNEEVILPIDVWISITSSAIKNYVLLHQLSRFASFVNGPAVGKGEAGINVLLSLERQLQDEEEDNFEDLESAIDKAAKLIDIYFGGHMGNSGVEWAISSWLRLLLTRFPFTLKYIVGFKNKLAERFDAKKVPSSSSQSGKIKSVGQIIRNSGEFQNWDSIIEKSLERTQYGEWVEETSDENEIVESSSESTNEEDVKGKGDKEIVKEKKEKEKEVETVYSSTTDESIDLPDGEISKKKIQSIIDENNLKGERKRLVLKLFSENNITKLVDVATELISLGFKLEAFSMSSYNYLKYR